MKKGVSTVIWVSVALLLVLAVVLVAAILSDSFLVFGKEKLDIISGVGETI